MVTKIAIVFLICFVMDSFGESKNSSLKTKGVISRDSLLVLVAHTPPNSYSVKVKAGDSIRLNMDIPYHQSSIGELSPQQTETLKNTLQAWRQMQKSEVVLLYILGSSKPTALDSSIQKIASPMGFSEIRYGPLSVRGIVRNTVVPGRVEAKSSKKQGGSFGDVPNISELLKEGAQDQSSNSAPKASLRRMYNYDYIGVDTSSWSFSSARGLLWLHEFEVLSVYQKYLDKNPQMKGKVQLEIKVKSTGKIERIVVTESELANAKMEKELVELLLQKSWDKKRAPKKDQLIRVNMFFEPK